MDCISCIQCREDDDEVDCSSVRGLVSLARVPLGDAEQDVVPFLVVIVIQTRVAFNAVFVL